MNACVCQCNFPPKRPLPTTVSVIPHHLCISTYPYPSSTCNNTYSSSEVVSLSSTTVTAFYLPSLPPVAVVPARIPIQSHCRADAKYISSPSDVNLAHVASTLHLSSRHLLKYYFFRSTRFVIMCPPMHPSLKLIPQL